MNESPERRVEVRVLRYDPESDRSEWRAYDVPLRAPGTVLGLLHHIKEEIDPTLVFRRSCEQGVCGSDAMSIDGRNRLACRTLVDDPSRTISVAPLPGLPVVRDLIVDMRPFYDNYKSVAPYLIGAGPAPEGRERLQSPEEKARFDNSTGCILCAACTTTCPVFRRRDTYAGPAALVAAHRFIFDSRDAGDDVRYPLVAHLDGAFGCRTAFSCTDACPRGVEVTRAIAEVKRWAVRHGSGREEDRRL
ncbi:succinate dehydrogenase iron-sulfur subunit [Actinomadura sp. KC216]|uniref:succinate dehydrogenase iron-sulfur subunit n=1 Tax=Actinomadura sp. KC216 TaxID=2530370 RepID=UPI00104F670C|nr:succinate dehydrogenase iron-sulfur subunit [Actinomadura sp. KC216]TDB83014.1 succinate dehydrogenase iron-sulfur subunit [Actinomadura sp. KC216]